MKILILLFMCLCCTDGFCSVYSDKSERLQTVWDRNDYVFSFFNNEVLTISCIADRGNQTWNYEDTSLKIYVTGRNLSIELRTYDDGKFIKCRHETKKVGKMINITELILTFKWVKAEKENRNGEKFGVAGFNNSRLHKDGEGVYHYEYTEKEVLNLELVKNTHNQIIWWKNDVDLNMATTDKNRLTINLDESHHGKHIKCIQGSLTDGYEQDSISIVLLKYYPNKLSSTVATVSTKSTQSSSIGVICGGGMAAVIFTIIGAGLLYKIFSKNRQTLRQQTETAECTPPNGYVYDYVPKQMMSFEDAKALAAANKKTYASFTPRLPDRPTQPSSDYDYAYFVK